MQGICLLCPNAWTQVQSSAPKQQVHWGHGLRWHTMVQVPCLTCSTKSIQPQQEHSRNIQDTKQILREEKVKEWLCEQGKPQAGGSNQKNPQWNPQFQLGRWPSLSFLRAKDLTCRQYRRQLLGAPMVKHFHSPVWEKRNYSLGRWCSFPRTVIGHGG